MKCWLKKVFLLTAVLTAFLVPRLVVYAEDYVSDAAKALQQTTVYVVPGTAGTDIDTASKLQGMLRSDDNIVLVMLPAEAETGTDIYSVVKSLSEKLGNQRTIGLAIGNDVIGYGPLLPSGVAADQMHRADSVSNDPVTALGTFARNMHTWLAAHPQPTPTPQPTPVPTPQPTLTPAQAAQRAKVAWGVVLGIITVIIILFAFRAKSIMEQNKKAMERNKRLAVLKPTEILLNDLQERVSDIRDSRIRNELNSACLVGQGLLENLQQTETPQGYTEEKFPKSVVNMDKLVRALLGHESGKHPLPPETLKQVKDLLLNFDEYFTKLQEGNEEAVELMTSVIESSNAMIDTLGFLPKDK